MSSYHRWPLLLRTAERHSVSQQAWLLSTGTSEESQEVSQEENSIQCLKQKVTNWLFSMQRRAVLVKNNASESSNSSSFLGFGKCEIQRLAGFRSEAAWGLAEF